MMPKFSKSEIIQKAQFLPTLLANFWYFNISTLISNGNWGNFGPAPPWKTFWLLAHCVHTLRWLVDFWSKMDHFGSIISIWPKLFQHPVSLRTEGKITSQIRKKSYFCCHVSKLFFRSFNRIPLIFQKFPLNTKTWKLTFFLFIKAKSFTFLNISFHIAISPILFKSLTLRHYAPETFKMWS